MPINSDVQKLEPGELVQLFELDLSILSGPIQRFHGYPTGPIVFQGITYHPWLIQAEGFERTGDVQQPSPTITVANIGVNQETGEETRGLISALCRAYRDMVGARVTVRQTFRKYLDGQPTADPSQELPPQIWYIEQRTNETPAEVQFELSGALTLDGLRLPGRPMQAGNCVWLQKGGYRGPYCQYTGTAFFTALDVPTGDQAQDKCGGRLTSCQLRFGAQQGVPPIAAVVNFGAFPSLDRIR